MSVSGHSMNRSRAEKPPGSLCCYFFGILLNASYDVQPCLFACFISAKILTFLL